jgi:hypothetical protein
MLFSLCPAVQPVCTQVQPVSCCSACVLIFSLCPVVQPVSCCSACVHQSSACVMLFSLCPDVQPVSCCSACVLLFSLCAHKVQPVSCCPACVLFFNQCAPKFIQVISQQISDCQSSFPRSCFTISTINLTIHQQSNKQQLTLTILFLSGRLRNFSGLSYLRTYIRAWDLSYLRTWDHSGLCENL